MRRAKEQKINQKVGAYKDLIEIIGNYQKKPDASPVLIEALQKVAGEFKDSAFQELVED